MKKALLVGMILMFVFSAATFAQDTGKFRLDGSAGISMAIISGDSIEADNPLADLAGFALTLASIRGGATGTLRYMLTDSLSAGAELGLYYMTVSDAADGGDSYTFIDLPLRAVARFGSGNTFIEGFGGYYLTMGLPLSGMEVGAKVSLGGLYALATYTIGQLKYSRYELGFSMNNLFSF